jgi:catechol 2,3-dioxygenase-like lactoylglutathione lyase family enzyme
MADQQEKAEAPVMTALDHVNIRTAHVEQLATFYCEVLGLARGPRPPFSFGGAWLYCGDKATIHLVDAVAAPPAAHDPITLGLSHFAFRATGIEAFVNRLRARRIPHQVARLPGRPIAQVNLRDPDGNALHVDFQVEGDGA